MSDLRSRFDEFTHHFGAGPAAFERIDVLYRKIAVDRFEELVLEDERRIEREYFVDFIPNPLVIPDVVNPCS